MRIKDIKGIKFGKLTAVNCVGSSKKGAEWYCKCDCGGSKTVLSSYLISGHTTSCGCNISKRAMKHGMSHTTPWNTHSNMKRRCKNPKNKDYHNYGGRGITYDPSWETFEGFWEDMKDGYEDGLTLDRIDVNGNYNKDNCRWATKQQQANNTRNNVYYNFKNEKLTLREICNKYKLDYDLSLLRLKSGWSLEDCFKDKKQKETITYNGVTKNIADFAVEYGLTYNQLKKRLMRGWTVERALTQPLKKYL